MRERRLRARCRQLLDVLEIEAPLEVTALCRRLAEHRGREIRLMPFALAVPGPFGLWFDTDERDIIVYQADTPKVHQDHIILHEVGHIVFDHGQDANPEETAELGPLLPFEGARRRLRRTCYVDKNEREAELIASVLGESMGLPRRPGLRGEWVNEKEGAAAWRLRATLAAPLLGTYQRPGHM